MAKIAAPIAISSVGPRPPIGLTAMAAARAMTNQDRSDATKRTDADVVRAGVHQSLHDRAFGRARVVRQPDDPSQRDACDRVEHGVRDRVRNDRDAGHLRSSPGKVLDEQPRAPGEQEDEERLDEVDPDVQRGVVPDLDFGRVDGADDDVADDRHKEARSTKPGLTLVSDRCGRLSLDGRLRLRLVLDDPGLHLSKRRTGANPLEDGRLGSWGAVFWCPAVVHHVDAPTPSGTRARRVSVRRAAATRVAAALLDPTDR